MASPDEKVTIYETPEVTTWCYPRLRIVHHCIHRHCHGAPFRECLAAGTDALRQFSAVGWLSDDQNYIPVSPEDEAWVKTHWIDRTLAAGWKFWAIVLPVHVIGQMNHRRFVEAIKATEVETKVFTELPEAWQWLRIRCHQPIPPHA